MAKEEDLQIESLSYIFKDVFKGTTKFTPRQEVIKKKEIPFKIKDLKYSWNDKVILPPSAANYDVGGVIMSEYTMLNEKGERPRYIKSPEELEKELALKRLSSYIDFSMPEPKVVDPMERLAALRRLTPFIDFDKEEDKVGLYGVGGDQKGIPEGSPILKVISQLKPPNNKLNHVSAEFLKDLAMLFESPKKYTDRGYLPSQPRQVMELIQKHYRIIDFSRLGKTPTKRLVYEDFTKRFYLEFSDNEKFLIRRFVRSGFDKKTLEDSDFEDGGINLTEETDPDSIRLHVIIDCSYMIVDTKTGLSPRIKSERFTHITEMARIIEDDDLLGDEIFGLPFIDNSAALEVLNDDELIVFIRLPKRAVRKVGFAGATSRDLPSNPYENYSIGGKSEVYISGKKENKAVGGNLDAWRPQTYNVDKGSGLIIIKLPEKFDKYSATADNLATFLKSQCAKSPPSKSEVMVMETPNPIEITTMREISPEFTKAITRVIAKEKRGGLKKPREGNYDAFYEEESDDASVSTRSSATSTTRKGVGFGRGSRSTLDGKKPKTRSDSGTFDGEGADEAFSDDDSDGDTIKNLEGEAEATKESRAENDQRRMTIMDTMVKPNKELTWDSISGLDELKELLINQILERIKNPKFYRQMDNINKGGKGETGVMLFGPGGTGKSFITKVLASEAGMTFFSLTGADLESKFKGEGEKMVKTLFQVAKEHRPAIIFIDEIDTLITKSSGSSDDSKIKNQLQTEMTNANDMGEERPITVIAATNYPEGFDGAIRRRFPNMVYVPLPDFKARLGMLKKIETTRLNDKDYEELAELLEGYSGSDISKVGAEIVSIIRQIYRSSNYFKQTDDPSLWEVAKETDPGAVKITLSDIYKKYKGEATGLEPTKKMFLYAIEKVPRTVSPEEVKRYDDFNAAFGMKLTNSQKIDIQDFMD